MTTIKKHLSYTQIKNMQKIQPLIISKLVSMGGVLPIEEMAKSYGMPAIDQAVHDKVINTVTVTRRDKKADVMDRQIPAVCLPTWDRSKPIWLV